MRAYMDTGGCLAECTSAEVTELIDSIPADDEYAWLKECVAADGKMNCWKCADGDENVPENCDEIEEWRKPGGCASQCTAAELNELAKNAKDDRWKECEFAGAGVLALVPGAALLLLFFS